MRLNRFGLSIITIFALSKATQAQKQISGPLIEEFGITYSVPNPDLAPDPNEQYNVVFDITKAPEDPAELNRYFNTVARFLNIHAAAGVRLEQLKPVVVIHGNAAFGLLKNEFYNLKFGVDNPNLPLFEKLNELNIPIILCGQTAAARGITAKKRWDHTQIALSAMTALIHYQNLGYAVLSF